MLPFLDCSAAGQEEICSRCRLKCPADIAPSCEHMPAAQLPSLGRAKHVQNERLVAQYRTFSPGNAKVRNGNNSDNDSTIQDGELSVQMM